MSNDILDDLRKLVVNRLSILQVHDPEWKHMTEAEKQWLRKWFIFPRLWK